MNSKELMELVNKREEHWYAKVAITFDPSITDEKRKKFLADVSRDVYYRGQNRKATELAWAWLMWVVLPTVVILAAYLLYLAVRATL